MSPPVAAAVTSSSLGREACEVRDVCPPRAVESAASIPSSASAFLALYDAHFAFVWRSVRRLGVEDGAVDDVVQEVFVVVHRRLSVFEGRSSLKTWLFGIVLHVVRDHRRTLRRKRPPTEGDVELLIDGGASPYESLEKAQAVRLLHALLDTLDDDKREVFVLSELEQLTATEIAEATATNVNTVYARLRAARKSFEAAVARHRAREEGRRTQRAARDGRTP